jgi:hypothetical protein
MSTHHEIFKCLSHALLCSFALASLLFSLTACVVEPDPGPAPVGYYGGPCCYAYPAYPAYGYVGPPVAVGVYGGGWGGGWHDGYRGGGWGGGGHWR